jgi:hypothetical protein
MALADEDRARYDRLRALEKIARDERSEADQAEIDLLLDALRERFPGAF